MTNPRSLVTLATLICPPSLSISPGPLPSVWNLGSWSDLISERHNTELALEQVDPGQPLHVGLMKIFDAATRSADLTRQLLAFARKQTITPKALDLNELVEGMLTLLRPLIGADVDLKWHPAADLWSVKIDPSPEVRSPTWSSAPHFSTGAHIHQLPDQCPLTRTLWLGITPC